MQTYGDSKSSGEREDFIKVKIHRDRALNCWKCTMSPPQLVKGIPLVQSRGEFYLLDPLFVVSEKLRKQFLKTKARNTHAWVEGFLTNKEVFSHKNIEGCVEIKYNIQKGEWLVLSSEGSETIFSFTDNSELEDRWHLYGCHFSKNGKLFLYFF